MAIEFTINAEMLIEELTKNITSKMQLAAEVLYDEILLNSPTDTFEYITGNKILPIVRLGNIVQTGVINETSHAYGVEYGFSSDALKWHKGPPRNDSTVFYTGVGASTYRRSIDNKQKEILNILKG